MTSNITSNITIGATVPTVQSNTYSGVMVNYNGAITSTIYGYPNMDQFNKLTDRIDSIEKRLAILQPNETVQEKYPALQEAYDAYKIIEQLVTSGEKK